MTDNERRQYNNHPYAYDFDEDWDVEKALREPQPAYRSRTVEQREHREEHHKLPNRPIAQEAPRPAARRSGKQMSAALQKKLKKGNLRGYLILGGLGLAAVLILALLIWLIASAFTPGDKEKQNNHEETTAYTETTEAPPSDLEQLIVRADALAASYDYDGAIELLREYGSAWEAQPELVSAKGNYETLRSATYAWTDTENIPLLSFQSLIVDAQRAFTGENADAYNRSMVTVAEFRAMLESLYANGYVLVGFHDVAIAGTNEAGTQTFMAGDIYLPEGKKPLILAQENVNYYEYMVDGDGDRFADANGAGFAHRLTVVDGQLVAEYYDSEGTLQTGAYDFAPILDAFVREHPDFSYHGARGILAVTGYQGVFGYRTQSEWELILGEEKYSEEIRGAQDVAKYLKSNGWEIASNGFSYTAFNAMTAEELTSDIRKWENQVQPIVGESDILLFPYGCDIESDGFYYSDTFTELSEAGFSYFTATGSYNTLFGPNYFRFHHKMINGRTLQFEPSSLEKFFDAAAILDPSRPPMIASIG